MIRLRSIPFVWLFIFLVSGLLLTAGGRIAPQDEETTFRMTANLIEYGRTTITEQEFTVEPQTYSGFLPSVLPRTLLTTWAVPGRDGQKYPQFMPGQAIVNMPLYLLGRWSSGEPLNSPISDHRPLDDLAVQPDRDRFDGLAYRSLCQPSGVFAASQRRAGTGLRPVHDGVALHAALTLASR